MQEVCRGCNKQIEIFGSNAEMIRESTLQEYADESRRRQGISKKLQVIGGGWVCEKCAETIKKTLNIQKL